MYDLCISGLIATGILGIVVFSFKMAHSRVYPIGIIPKVATPQKDLMTPDLLKPITKEALHYVWHERYLQKLRDEKTFTRVIMTADSEGQEWDLKLREILQQPRPSSGEKHAKLEEKVTEHDEALKLLEKRIRQLEVSSAEKSEAVPEESQPSQQEHVN